MQNILLGPSQWSFTCENTVWIQPLAACTKPQGESTLKWCKVHRLDTNPQNQLPRATFRLAELVNPLTPTCLSHYRRREPRSRVNTMARVLSSCYGGCLYLGEDAEAQIPYQRIEWERKITKIHEEGRDKVTDALDLSMCCIRRAYSSSHFIVKLPFAFQSYI